MKRINNIFHSLQGEGINTGRPAVFIRFAGCNLHCPFCDTEFTSFTEMSDDDIIAAITPFKTHFCVLTGGEPSLQVNETFVDLLHSQGFEVAMETNGTHPVPSNLDWLTVSPKSEGIRLTSEPIDRHIDELKVIFENHQSFIHLLSNLPDSFMLAKHRLVQPCDTGDAKRNQKVMNECVDYVKQNPQWRLSLQTHKLIGIE